MLKFPPDAQFSDDELFAFCAANKALRIERDEKGRIIIMPPTGGISGNRNFKFTTKLGQWAAANEHLGFGFDSSRGFRLPNKSMRAPDAAWVSKDRWENLQAEDKKGSPLLTPDFVVEIRLESDSLSELKNKLLEWITNGCRLDWLIDPLEQKAYVYRASCPVQTIGSFKEILNGADVLPGFELDLAVLK